MILTQEQREAAALYAKGKLSLEAAAKHAGVDIETFGEILRQLNVERVFDPRRDVWSVNYSVHAKDRFEERTRSLGSKALDLGKNLEASLLNGVIHQMGIIFLVEYGSIYFILSSSVSKKLRKTGANLVAVTFAFERGNITKNMGRILDHGKHIKNPPAERILISQS